MATELIGVRIEKETVKFLRNLANKERRTLSGAINLCLENEKARLSTKKLKEAKNN